MEKPYFYKAFFCCLTLTDVFNTYLPGSAAEYCRTLWQQYGFVLKVVRPRRTRLGDFRALPHNQMQITVNGNLNPYAFLITYVHEVAHADVYRQQRSRRLPHHGKPWQQAFQRLMQPLLNETVFPDAVLIPLQQYMCRPAATTYANPALMAALRLADKLPEDVSSSAGVLLRDVPEGHSFRLQKKTFVRGTLRRTRIVCKEVASGKSYAILAHAWVETN